MLQYEKVPPTLHDSFLQYRRTYRVFDENGRLMIEALGQAPERLLKQSDGKFAMRSSPQELISFTIMDHQATQLRINQGPDLTLAGQRIGPGARGHFTANTASNRTGQMSGCSKGRYFKAW